MTAPRAEFRDVWKRLRRVGSAVTFAELLYDLPRRLVTRRSADGLLAREFWALRDTSFTLQPGEMLGIVGPNGAGKSTILKLLFKIFRPDRGSVTINGRITGLIELGAGFHPMLTGRENVFINGAILGLKQKEIRACYDQIVEFAELAEFMDMPVKNYSSGMYARLAFSIAAHARPDLLLVDEVLAVGDEPFQQKCYAWVADMRRKGCAVVLVSHNLDVIRPASRCIYLDKGRIIRAGDTDDVIAAYRASMNKQAEVPAPEQEVTS
jgi:lipopolysaccharide transport system ATP-binding protein